MNSKPLGLLAFLCVMMPSWLWADSPPLTGAPIVNHPTWPVTTTVSDTTALPVTIPANDPHIRYMGRFDSNKGDPRCSWTDSAVLLKFKGTDLNAQLEDTGRTFWEIEIDGKPVRKIPLGIGSHLYRIASDLAAGPHTVRLVRVSEATLGPTQIHGFQLSRAGSLLPVEIPTRRLEVIGDSITCGGAILGVNGVSRPSNLGEDGYLNYAAVTSRKLGLDFRCVSMSGRKMYPKKDIPDVYDFAIPSEKESLWDFSKWIPDAIVINLSTNDFRQLPVDEMVWTGAYEAFIKRLRGHFPNAVIYCATSPMLTGDKLTVSKTYLTKIVSDLNTAGDTKVHYLEFASENPADGIGAANHPNVKTHQIMGDKLAAQLSKDLGWPDVAHR